MGKSKHGAGPSKEAGRGEYAEPGEPGIEGGGGGGVPEGSNHSNGLGRLLRQSDTITTSNVFGGSGTKIQLEPHWPRGC